MRTFASNEKGMVLLVVVVMVALLSAVLVELTFTTLVQLRLTETYRDRTRAYYLAKGGIQVGRMLLQEDDNSYDAYSESWAQPVPAYPVGDGQVSLQITDEDGKIDLNRLITAQGNIDTVVQDRFLRLLETLEISDGERLCAALIDWIDEDSEALKYGAETPYYQGLATPYQAKNAPLDTLGELSGIRGFTATVRKRLTPCVTVSGDAYINVNTAGREVLLSLSEQMTDQEVETILAARAEKPFTAVSKLKDLTGMESVYGFIFRYLKVTSEYYAISSAGEFGDGRCTLAATVKKSQNDLQYFKIE